MISLKYGFRQVREPGPARCCVFLPLHFSFRGETYPSSFAARSTFKRTGSLVTPALFRTLETVAVETLDNLAISVIVAFFLARTADPPFTTHARRVYATAPACAPGRGPIPAKRSAQRSPKVR